MGDQAPPTLVQLAAQKLLENQALAISALEDLPCHVFPLLFFEAFKKKHSKLLKAMVQAWPFPCLPPGGRWVKIWSLIPWKSPWMGSTCCLFRRIGQGIAATLEILQLQDCGMTKVHFTAMLPGLSRCSRLTTVCFCDSRISMAVLRNLISHTASMSELCHEIPSTLSTMSLPTLRQLAMQSLLEDQALAISALDVLPLDLFSTLFREVVAKRRMEVLKAMVQAWPFACLPLGALVGSADLEILQVTLEGLDVLLEQGAGPRCKVQMIDLRNMSLNLWTWGYIAMSQACSAAALTDKPAANHCADLREEPPFRIFMDVTISDGPWDCVLANLLQWVETRREQVQLCSKKLQIGMKYSASRFKISFFIQLLQQRNLQQIYMYQVYFLYGNLHKVFRTVNLGDLGPGPLRALLERVSGTLEALALEHCGITEAQLSAILPTLSQCCQLSFFSIYGNRMSLAALQNLLSHTARLRQLQRGLYPAPVQSYDHECLLCGCEVNKVRFAQVCMSPSTLSTMSLHTLWQLAMQSLLEDQALAISALDVLPLDLFSTLFREVVAKRRMEVLKAMVQAWPFACLPLGALVGSADLEILQVTLEGLDVLLEQGAGPRCKLQVLDLQNRSLNIWTSGYIAMSKACSAAALTDKPAANHCADLREKPPFRIFVDVTISDGPWDCVLAHVLQWVETRRDQVQLCSKKLKVLFASISGCTSKIQSTLRVLHLGSIQELVVDDLWHHKTAESMVPYLGKMKNLRKLSLAKMKMECCSCFMENFHKYLSEMLLQGNHLICDLESFFPNEKLEKVFSQLKHLRLRSVHMGDLCPGPLQALLERVSGTLEALAIEHCGITDDQLSAILPALSQCSQLRWFSIYGNPITLAALQNLLSHTARLRQLQRGLYPAPVESYDDRWAVRPSTPCCSPECQLSTLHMVKLTSTSESLE
ncbi:PREDICTED: uncharacterized protein LOC105997593 [Dipodomys ordii]|uniref:Uncharacterized protein LOC105997593 n=1 Tax=Dipodomys ordii TaxID=10020 RepID=A0A1S3GH25_DIPOR|nr:PREDICTED: uncharacterized protein LOC105997593 [Dipodomys ordii]